MPVNIKREAWLAPVAIGATDGLFKPNPILWMGVIIATALFNGRFEPYTTPVQVGSGAILGREVVRRIV